MKKLVSVIITFVLLFTISSSLAAPAPTYNEIEKIGNLVYSVSSDETIKIECFEDVEQSRKCSCEIKYNDLTIRKDTDGISYMHDKFNYHAISFHFVNNGYESFDTIIDESEFETLIYFLESVELKEPVIYHTYDGTEFKTYLPSGTNDFVWFSVIKDGKRFTTLSTSILPDLKAFVEKVKK